MRGGSAVAQGGSGGHGEKWRDLGCMWKGEPIGYADEFDEAYKGKGRVKAGYPCYYYYYQKTESTSPTAPTSDRKAKSQTVTSLDHTMDL